jgi:hypothetical protein
MAAIENSRYDSHSRRKLKSVSPDLSLSAIYSAVNCDPPANYGLTEGYFPDIWSRMLRMSSWRGVSGLIKWGIISEKGAE